MKVLLTGSSGVLGQVIAHQLRDAGEPFVGIDVRPHASTSVVGSVTDRALIRQLMTEHQFDCVIHTATLHKRVKVFYWSTRISHTHTLRPGQRMCKCSPRKTL